LRDILDILFDKEGLGNIYEYISPTEGKGHLFMAQLINTFRPSPKHLGDGYH
jgi:hypothetical protein